MRPVGALDLFKLDGKVALVTGAGSGLRRAYAEALTDAGAHLACVDLDLAAAETVASELRARGRRAVALRCDVCREADVAAAFAGAAEQLGPVDIAFANAGVAENRQPILEATL